MTKGKYRVLLTVLAVAAAVTAVVATTAYGGAKAKKVIVDGSTGTVVNIDPANEYDYDSFSVDLNIFQGLYGFPHGAKLAPVLATGCTHSTNLKTWTCKLRHNVHFSNGDLMTSTDVKYSFDRVQAIQGDQGIYTLLSYLTSTTTSGQYTVVFHLSHPFSIWPYILSTNAGYVVDHNTFPSNSILANTDTAHMIGTGPYKLTGFTPGQQAVFAPNSNYWGTAPANGGLIIKYYSSSSTMKLDLQQGKHRHGVPDLHADRAQGDGQASVARRPPRPRRGHPLSRLQREAEAVQQHPRPEGDRVPHAAGDDREARLPQHGGAALFHGAEGPTRPVRRVQGDVRGQPQPRQGEGGDEGS